VIDVTRGQIQSAFMALQNKRLITKVVNVIFVEESGLAKGIKANFNIKN